LTDTRGENERPIILASSVACNGVGNKSDGLASHVKTGGAINEAVLWGAFAKGWTCEGEGVN